MKDFYYLVSSTGSLEENDVGILKNKISEKNLTIKFLRTGQEVSLDSSHVMPFDITKVGDGFDHKVCDRCFKRLSTNDFSGNRIKKGVVVTKRPSCKSCRKIKDGKSISAKDRKDWNQKKPDNYDLFKCPICNKLSIAGISKIVLDHNHNTGRVRGWLCESCNTGIGRFDDNPEIVIRAKKWLSQTKEDAE